MAGNLWFSQMEDGDKVEVTQRSTGCFHDTTSYYEVNKGRGAYTLSEYAITWGSGKIQKKRLKASMKLTGKDIRGLDGLWKYYRSEKQGGSTTHVSLLAEYYEGDKRIKTERLEDWSGGFGFEKEKDVVTFSGLIRRFERSRSKKEDAKKLFPPCG